MSTKSIVSVLVVIILLGVVGWWYMMSEPVQAPVTQEASAGMTVPAARPSSEAALVPATPSGGSSVTGSDTSDAALLQDMNSVNSGMSGLASDTAAANAQAQ